MCSGGFSLSEIGFLRTGQTATPVVVSIAFDDGGMAITDRYGKVDWLAYSALVVRDSPGDRIILGQRFRPRFRLDLAGSAAREFRARTPPLESRWSRLRRWAIRSPKLAALAMTSGFSIGDLAGGVVDGLQMLGEYGNHPPVMHTDTP